jgi:hypothetical protein
MIVISLTDARPHCLHPPSTTGVPPGAVMSCLMRVNQLGITFLNHTNISIGDMRAKCIAIALPDWQG